MPTNPPPITLSALARRAAEIVDPEEADPDVGHFQRHLEDADEPARGIENLEERLSIAADGFDLEHVEIDGAGLAMVQALTLYLAYRRDAFDADPEHLLRMAARAEWKGHPPQPVADWLSERGISL